MNVHATCIRIGRAGKPFGAPANAGVLILGKSGAGKSDLALRLIGLGAELVADDRVDLTVERGRLIARAPTRLAGLLEVRGVGIVRVRHAKRVAIALAIELAGKVSRLPEPQTYAPPALLNGAKPLPLIRLDPFETSAPQKVLIAAAFRQAHARKSL